MLGSTVLASAVITTGVDETPESEGNAAQAPRNIVIRVAKTVRVFISLTSDNNHELIQYDSQYSANLLMILKR